MQQIIYIMDFLGVVVFAVSGSLAAGKKRMDLFGVLVLAMVTSLGGGTLRDMLLDSGPVFWVADPAYLLVVLGASIATFIAVRTLNAPRRRWFLVFDAMGLAVFTVIGTAKALETGTGAGVAVVMGVMTGVAGGIIRDVLSAEVPLVLRKEIYAVGSLCGAIVYVLMNMLHAVDTASIIVSILSTFIIRMAAIRWGLSLPVFTFKGGGSTDGEEK